LAVAKTVQENAQIVFFPRIETAQTVRKMHRLYFFLKLLPQTDEDSQIYKFQRWPENRLRSFAGAKTKLRQKINRLRKMLRLEFYCELRSQTVRKMHRLYFFLKLRPQTEENAQIVFFLKLRPLTEENAQIVFFSSN
jgi:hypothetical protein